MDKPAVVFSEQGWKEFLRFMRDVAAPREKEENEDAAVDRLISEYNKRETEPEEKPKPSRRTAGDVVKRQRDELFDLMGRKETRLSDIYKHMQEQGFWSGIPSKAATGKMMTIMRHYPELKPLGQGVYQFETQEVNDNE